MDANNRATFTFSLSSMRPHTRPLLSSLPLPFHPVVNPSSNPKFIASSSQLFIPPPLLPSRFTLIPSQSPHPSFPCPTSQKLLLPPPHFSYLALQAYSITLHSKTLFKYRLSWSEFLCASFHSSLSLVRGSLWVRVHCFKYICVPSFLPIFP